MRETALARRILIVDDDRFQRELLGSGLAEQGHYVTMSSNGADALYSFVETRFDLVVLDYKMAGMDGIVTAKAIRDLAKLGDAPQLVALTSRAKELAERERREGLAFDSIIPKQSVDNIVETISQLLEHAVHRSPRAAHPVYH